MWFFLNLHLQQVLGYSAFPSGAAPLPMTVLTMIGMILLGPRAIAALGPKTVTVLGLLLPAAGMAWLSFVRTSGTFAVDVRPGLAPATLAMSLDFIPTLGTAISSAPAINASVPLPVDPGPVRAAFGHPIPPSLAPVTRGRCEHP